MIWFSADLHYNHNNIIKYCKRPFATIEDMNAALIQRWNEKVNSEDTVWFLGDFCWKNSQNVFYQLNGEKHLIIGNHDGPETLALPWASQPRHYKEIHVQNTKLILFHYGIRSWVNMQRGSIMLHGHSHNKLPGFQTESGGTLDVGVDCWDFYPVDLYHIKERILTLPKFSPEIQ